jgi:hypothetical protein
VVGRTIVVMSPQCVAVAIVRTAVDTCYIGVLSTYLHNLTVWFVYYPVVARTIVMSPHCVAVAFVRTAGYTCYIGVLSTYLTYLMVCLLPSGGSQYYHVAPLCRSCYC